MSWPGDGVEERVGKEVERKEEKEEERERIGMEMFMRFVLLFRPYFVYLCAFTTCSLFPFCYPSCTSFSRTFRVNSELSRRGSGKVQVGRQVRRIRMLTEQTVRASYSLLPLIERSAATHRVRASEPGPRRLRQCMYHMYAIDHMYVSKVVYS